MNHHVSLEDAMRQLSQEKQERFTLLMRSGSMQLEYYAPKEQDLQTPHRQDELYIIASGHSHFFRGGEVIACKTGDALFVPSGMEHRFFHFSADFATWVIFWGPEGGERSSGQGQ